MKSYQSAARTKETCSISGDYQPDHGSAQGKGYAARTDFPHAAGVVQCKRYTISKELPLETHYALIEESSKGKSSKEKAQDTMLSNLREAHPLSEEHQIKAKTESWSGLQRDNQRGEEFNKKKIELLSKLEERQKFLGETAKQEEQYPLKKEERSATGHWVPGAHVKGLSVASERGRKKTPESQLITKITKENDWIGAHLIKREWGGEDNMWNVVCWPKAAEDAWGLAFEEPIDMAFTNKAIRNLDISVSVEKEDETFTEEEVAELLKEKMKDKQVSTEWNQFIQSTVGLARLTSNRAMESIPLKAKGESRLGTANLTATETRWEGSRVKALQSITEAIDSSTKKSPAQKEMVKLKADAVPNKKKSFEEERGKALNEESLNYRSEIYDLGYNL